MQQDNQKPDYSFIMNQPGPEPVKAKNRKKPLVIIASGVMFLMLLTFIAVVIGRQATNVKQVAPGINESKEFLNHIADNNQDAAYNMYAATSRPQDKAFFKDGFVKPFSEHFDAKKCSLRADTVQQAGTSVTLIYRCPAKNKPTGYMDLIFAYQKTETANQLLAVQTAGVQL